MTSHTGFARLRLFTLEHDRLSGQPLADALLKNAQKAGLAGGSVLRGTSGFGRRGLETALDVQEYRPDRQPIIVEFVDDVRKLKAFIQTVRAQGLPDRLISLEALSGVFHR